MNDSCSDAWMPDTSTEVAASKVRRRRLLSRLKVQCFSVSLDGFGAGPSQDLDHPLVVGGSLGSSTREPGKEMHGIRRGRTGGGETGVEDQLAAKRVQEHRSVDYGTQHVRARAGGLAGRKLAWLAGRGASLPHGWCSCSPIMPHAAADEGRDEVPLRNPRASKSALAQAKEAVAGKDVRLGGGVAT